MTETGFLFLFWFFKHEITVLLSIYSIFNKGRANKLAQNFHFQKQVYQKELSDFKMLHISKVMDIEACS